MKSEVTVATAREPDFPRLEAWYKDDVMLFVVLKTSQRCGTVVWTTPGTKELGDCDTGWAPASTSGTTGFFPFNGKVELSNG